MKGLLMKVYDLLSTITLDVESSFYVRLERGVTRNRSDSCGRRGGVM